MNTNSRWVDYATEKPPDGSSVLVWLEEEHIACKYAVLTSMEIANGYLETINGIFLFDLDIKILAWCYLDDMLEELPLKYRNDK